jgi:pyridoxine 4-dehydrogenase
MSSAAAFPGHAFAALGQHRVLRVGYGAMQLEHAGSDAAIRVLRHAVDLGVNHIDTAQFYGNGQVNALIRTALHPYPAGVQLVTKVGARHTGSALQPAQRPDELRAQVESNLAALDTDRLAVVNLRRLDTRPGIVATGDQVVDLDSQLAELVALRDEGKIEGIGLSQVDGAQLRQAAPAGIVCVQNIYNLLERDHEATLKTCEQLDIAWVPFFPLGSAFADRTRVTDSPVVIEQAARLGLTPAQAALAWLLGHSARTLLIPGTRTLDHLVENVDAARVTLDAAARAAFDRLADPEPMPARGILP